MRKEAGDETKLIYLIRKPENHEIFLIPGFLLSS